MLRLFQGWVREWGASCVWSSGVLWNACSRTMPPLPDCVLICMAGPVVPARPPKRRPLARIDMADLSASSSDEEGGSAKCVGIGAGGGGGGAAGAGGGDGGATDEEEQPASAGAVLAAKRRAAAAGGGPLGAASTTAGNLDQVRPANPVTKPTSSPESGLKFRYQCSRCSCSLQSCLWFVQR